MKFRLLPTPPELFRQYERGELSREQLQSAMAVHARGLIEEMQEAHKNPIAAYIEQLRNRATAARLSGRHGGARVREVLVALGEIPNFPPAQILWNADHEDVPLHCFFRTKHDPVFRVLRLKIKPMEAKVAVEYGSTTENDIVKETILLKRNLLHRLEMVERKQSGLS